MVGAPVGVDEGDTVGDLVGPSDAVIVGATDGVLLGAVVVEGLVGTGVGPVGGWVGASVGDGDGDNSPWIAISTLKQKVNMVSLMNTSPSSSKVMPILSPTQHSGPCVCEQIHAVNT
jgi:hypothetical protein